MAAEYGIPVGIPTTFQRPQREREDPSTLSNNVGLEDI